MNYKDINDLKEGYWEEEIEYFNIITKHCGSYQNNRRHGVWKSYSVSHVIKSYIRKSIYDDGELMFYVDYGDEGEEYTTFFNRNYVMLHDEEYE